METNGTEAVSTTVITTPVKTGTDKLVIALAGAAVSFATSKLIEEGYARFVISRRTVEIIESVVTEK